LDQEISERIVPKLNRTLLFVHTILMEYNIIGQVYRYREWPGTPLVPCHPGLFPFHLARSMKKL
jgi:hypothetical protein